MDRQTQVRQFLTYKRNQLTPDQAGFKAAGARKVPGLRREEVAQLAGISLEYYTRIERGRLAGVSAQVLEALARALQLTDDERIYLFDLAQPHKSVPDGTAQGSKETSQQELSDFLLRFLDSVTAPALVQNHRLEILAANDQAQKLFSPLFAQGQAPASSARFVFLSSQAPDFYENYQSACDITVGVLRSSVAKFPQDQALALLVEELKASSPIFAQLWDQYRVLQKAGGRKVIHHPTLGRLDLTYDDLILPDQPNLLLLTYMATPGTDTESKLPGLLQAAQK